MLAHSVRDNRPFLARGCHHRPAGTHTERIDPPVLQMHNPLVGGRRQQIGGRAVLHPVDVALQMLHTHPNGEPLGLHQQPVSVQHADGVAGRMSQSD